MRFSRYMILVVSLYVVFVVAMGAAFSLVSVSLALLFVVTLLLLGVPLTLVNFALLSKRLDDYGGRYPMPGFWGLLGVDIVDDDYDPAEDSPEDRPHGAGIIPDGVEYDNLTLGRAARREEPELDAYGRPISHVYHCAYCEAPLLSSTAKFCSECGQPVAPTLPAGKPPPG